MIELFHEWNSVHSFKVRVVLAEKNIAWEDRRLELLEFEHLQPAYLKLNPNAVVPTLVHDGRVITESSVICQYLDDAFPSPRLLPEDPYGRAMARTWLKYFDEIVHAPIRRASFEILYRPLLAKMTPEDLEARLASHPDPARARAFREMPSVNLDATLATFKTIIEKIDGALKNDWLTGPEFGLADVAMAPFAERLEHLGFTGLWKDHPRGKTWRDRTLARPSVIAARAPAAFRFPPPS